VRARVLFAAVLVALTIVLFAAYPVLAGSPHFVGTSTATRSGDTLTVSGKVAGLGNETQITVTLTADVACVNPGGNEPKAENKGAVIATGQFPVQNGKALFDLSGTGTTDPDCDPPMTLRYSKVTVTVSDTTFEPFSFTFDGTF
jgi:hypothetical protein